MFRRLVPLVGLGIPEEAADDVGDPVDLDAGKDVPPLDEGHTHSDSAVFTIHHVNMRRPTTVLREVLEKEENIDDLALEQLKIRRPRLVILRDVRDEVLHRLGLEPIGQEELVRLHEARVEVQIQVDRQIVDRSGPHDVRRHGKPRGCRWDRAE